MVVSFNSRLNNTTYLNLANLQLNSLSCVNVYLPPASPVHYFSIEMKQLCTSLLLNMGMFWTSLLQPCLPCSTELSLCLPSHSVLLSLFLVTHPRPKIFPFNNVLQFLEHDVNKLYICHILGPITFFSFAWSAGQRLNSITHRFR